MEQHPGNSPGCTVRASLASPFGRGGRAQRGRRGQTKKNRLRAVLQLVDKPSLCGKQFLYAGGARGGEARLESDQMSRKALSCKACVERSDYFRAARRHKNNDILSGCRKSRRLFRQPESRHGRVCSFAMSLAHAAVTPHRVITAAPSGRSATRWCQRSPARRRTSSGASAGYTASGSAAARPPRGS